MTHLPALPRHAVGAARTGLHLNRFLVCAAAAELGRSRELPACAVETEQPEAWDRDPSFAVVLRSGAWSRRLLAVRALENGRADAALAAARGAVASNFGNPGMVDHLILGRAFDLLALPDSALQHYDAALHVGRDGMFPTAAAVAFPLAPVYRRAGELAVRDRLERLR